MGDVPIGRREAGGRSPGGGRSVTQREVMRAVAMMIEKKGGGGRENKIKPRGMGD